MTLNSIATEFCKLCSRSNYIHVFTNLHNRK